MICQFNSNLIEAYSQSEHEHVKSQCLPISKKNLQIAQKYYGEGSIYTVKYLLGLSS
jgi:hypothetical protein